jgi:hypothetical protein
MTLFGSVNAQNAQETSFRAALFGVNQRIGYGPFGCRAANKKVITTMKSSSLRFELRVRRTSGHDGGGSGAPTRRQVDVEELRNTPAPMPL